MVVDFGNADALDAETRERITSTLTRLLTAPTLFPIQRTQLPYSGFFTTAEVTVLLVDDDKIQRLNQTWRGKDSATDVLSWPAVGVVDPLEPYLGDIAVSLDTAKKQAATRCWDVTDELCLLTVHGFLHLLGHDDDDDDDALRMRVLERYAIGKPLTKDGDDNAEA